MASLAELAGRLKPAVPAPDRRLPLLILMTDTRRLPDPTAAIMALPRRSAVIFRHYDAPHRIILARDLAETCRRRGVRFLIAGDARLARAVGADGVHLPERIVRHGLRTWRAWRPPHWLVTAAAHSLAAVRAASLAGADAVLLSPVLATASHPDVAVMGPVRFSALVRRSPLPAYALGGISEATARRLTGSGAAGFAAIGGLSGVS